MAKEPAHKHPKIVFNGRRYYRDPRTGYYYTTYRDRKKTILHRDIWEHHNGEIPPGFVIHHADHDRGNNKLANLECVSLSSHSRHHANTAGWAGSAENLKQLASINHLAKAWHSTPEGLAWHSENGKKAWEGRKLYPLKCQVCGNAYETPYPTRSKYCHQNCKARALRARRAATQN